ncbi:MAG TPA: GntR family transcriptional regulator [Clostridia bacterium]|nr:GntR family transcriptional regulator [Clostridia bacterium]
MISIDFRSRVPIYEQIINQISELVTLEILKPNDQLPSIRSLASELKLNVNTVKRAFTELESAGMIYTLSGRGSFISEKALQNHVLKSKALVQIETALRVGRSSGLSKNEVSELLDRIYDKKEDSN